MLADVNADAQDRGQQISLVFDRDTMARLGLTLRHVDAVLNDLSVNGRFRHLSTAQSVSRGHGTRVAVLQSPESLQDVYVIAPNGKAVPLAAFSHYETTNTPLR